MARVRGRDVVLDLMDSVQALRTEAADQRELLEAHSELLSRLVASNKRQEGHLARVARLLGKLADDTSRRFEELEDRVDRLEAAS